MADRIDAHRRSRNMAQVKSSDTGPELAVRRLAHALGYRFRLHRRSLPGTPDLVFPSRRLALFVHGCFWHRHAGCPKASVPATRTDFWTGKFDANVRRDERVTAELAAAGWNVAIIWECEVRDRERLAIRLQKLLGGNASG